MFNLLVSYDLNAWSNGKYRYDLARFAEYTKPSLSERYRSFSAASIQELKSFPTLFVIEVESGGGAEARIGYITDIEVASQLVEIEFQLDKNFPLISMDVLENLESDLSIDQFEFYRTHWAVKDVDLFSVLIARGLIVAQDVNKSHFRDPAVLPPVLGSETEVNKRVFVVHGQDELAKLDMAACISDLGLQPIILHQQANQGMTIIEKIEEHTNVGFAVVLYTGCDVGAKNTRVPTLKMRARQNVVFEHGYLIARLGRSKVAAFVKPGIEIPNDISGVVYIEMDAEGNWKDLLIREMSGVVL